jgi:predicted phage-related endonuclease/superfamily II DNA or RNA helicase
MNSTQVVLSTFTLQLQLENGRLSLKGDTYQVHKALNFKSGGFRFDGAAWYRPWAADLLAAVAWLNASWRERKWQPEPARESESVQVHAVVGDDFFAALPATLFAHQRAGIQRMIAHLQSNRTFLLADAPRVGKTYQILATLRYFNKKTLVVSPASVVGMWRAQLSAWGVEGEALSYEAFRRAAQRGEVPAGVGMLVLDEAHKVKNRTAQVTKAVKKFIAENADMKVIFATGTPFQNAPDELENILEMLVSKQAKSIIALGTVKVKNKYRARGYDLVWARDLSKLRNALTASEWYLRRELKDVASDIPALTRETLVAEGSEWKKVLAEVDAALENLENEYRAEGKDQQADRVAAVRSGLFSEADLGALFPIASTLRALLGEAKVAFARQLIEDVIEDTNESILIFTHHAEVRDALAAHLQALQVRYGIIAGETPQAERQAIADAFQRGELRALILSTRAAGEGLTLSRAARAIFVELDWNPAVLTQAENRLQNVAEREPKLAQYIIAPHALERRMVELVAEKARAAEGVYASEGSIAKVDTTTAATITAGDGDDDPTPGDDDPTPGGGSPAGGDAPAPAAATTTPDTTAGGDAPAPAAATTTPDTTAGGDAPAPAAATTTPDTTAGGDAPAPAAATTTPDTTAGGGEWWGVGEPTGAYAQHEGECEESTPHVRLPDPELPLCHSLFDGLSAAVVGDAEPRPVRVVQPSGRGRGWWRKGEEHCVLDITPLADSTAGGPSYLITYGPAAAPRREVVGKGEALRIAAQVLQRSLRPPKPATVALLVEWGLLEVRQPHPSHQRRRKGAGFRSVDSIPLRGERVGFSEIAAVMGVSPFKTPLELWREKVGLDTRAEPTLAMRWGTETEAVALRLWLEQKQAEGEEVGRKYLKVCAADGPLAGELDAVVRLGGEWVVVEIKVASSTHATNAYHQQVNAQLGATGLRKGVIVTLVGNRYFAEEWVEFDAALYQQQKQAAQAFLEAVRTQTPPLPPELAASGGGSEGVAVEAGDAETVQLMQRLAEIEAQYEALKEERDTLRERLKMLLETAQITKLTTPHGVATLQLIESERFDSKAFKKDHQDLAKQYIVTTKYTQLKIKFV